MTTESPITFHPIDASKSGKNAFALRCKVYDQSMAYCACLNRLAKVDAGTAPADWAACGKARKDRTCVADQMRQEELLKGHSIFFAARQVFDAAVASAKNWIQIWKTPEPTPGSPSKGLAPAGKSLSALESMGELGDYSDAITAAATIPSPAPKKAPAARSAAPAAPVPTPSVSTGESPLALARRLAAERKANPST